MQGPPLLRTVGDGHTPFNLDTYDGDVGMAYIAGPIGSGKSTLLATMVMQWLKYPGAEVRIFDTGQSLRCATYAVGGHWYDVAAELEHQTRRGQRLDDPDAKLWGSPWMPPPERWQCFELGNLLKTPERPGDGDAAAAADAQGAHDRRADLVCLRRRASVPVA